jgi:hypothetical protein
MKKIYTITFAFVIMTLFSGCAITNSTAKLVPNSSIESKKLFYVIQLKTDKRNLSEIIAETLKQKGFNAISGTYENRPQNVDVLVTYEDRWMWDISNYMIQLDMQFRDARDMYPFVAGETIRTSLARKTSEGMILETVETMLKKMKEGN